MPDDNCRIVVGIPEAIGREALCALLTDGPDLQVVAQAENGRDAVAFARRLEPDLMLIDMALRNVSAMQVVRETTHLAPSVRMMLMGDEFATEELGEAIELGVRGILLHNTPVEMLFKSILCVHAGEYWIRRERVSDAFAYLRERNRRRSLARRNTHGLTPREFEMVHAVVYGWSNKEIARNFEISDNTAKHHLTSVFAKLGVANRLELALFALDTGLVRQARRCPPAMVATAG